MNNLIAGIRLSIASPEQIRSWSSGEVTLPATINVATGKPKVGSLFCERIFGPIKDWSCACGKYQRQRSPGFICEVCGVEIAHSNVRRTRMGHIELAIPVAHPWFAKGQPSYIARLLDISPRQLTAILSYHAYLVLSVKEEMQLRLSSPKRSNPIAPTLLATMRTLSVGAFLDAKTYFALVDLYGQFFQAETGAEAIRKCLAKLDLERLSTSLRTQLVTEPHSKCTRRLHIVETLRTSGIRPEWMIFTVLPVLPPSLRPLITLKNGRLASSDVNMLYERVLHRNTRLKTFIKLQAPEIILNNEKRLLQLACEALLDNGHCKPQMMRTRKQAYKSLTDSLAGKQGRFRRNLLGKRVDYSGRSVITGDPSLQLQQCGLPTSMCLELFKPFIVRILVERHLVTSARAGKRMVEKAHKLDFLLWDVLEEVMEKQVVLLNRAPTLHRLSIQAFEAVRVEGSAIRLHPLVCNAFNADFDGDQMAVHVPLFYQAQQEARELLLSSRNLRGAAAGEPAISIGQEMALGLFYLTQERPSKKQTRRLFTSSNEALLAMEHGVIDLHTRIIVRLDTEFLSSNQSKGTAPHNYRIETTAGRLIFNEALPRDLRYINEALSKERIKQLIAQCLRTVGVEETVLLADRLKKLGFTYATKSGLSFAISDIATLPEKQTILQRAEASAETLEKEVTTGMITIAERDAQLIHLWTQTTEEIAGRLQTFLDPWGSLSTIIQSGATKAKFQQIRQLSGIRGLMVNPSGKIIPIPIKGNYLEGLKTWEVFIAASGARKGFMDRSLNTAKSGYLTRRLVEVGMEVWITMEECGTHEGIWITQAESQALGLPNLKSRVVGRILVSQPEGTTLLPNTLLTEEIVDTLLQQNITALHVRSPLTCEAAYGLCQQCYGTDLTTGQLAQCGLAVGIIAGQSVGEPGTQLTMRTFHSGGIAGAQGDITRGLPRVEELFEARVPRNPALLAETDGLVQITQSKDRSQHIRIVSSEGEQVLLSGKKAEYTLPWGRKLLVTAGQIVTIGTQLCEGPCDPQQILHISGRETCARYLINEVQQVYRSTGVYINDKHLECLIRQMLRFVLVQTAGDSSLLPGAIVDRFTVLANNAKILAEGGTPASVRPILLGLTRTALQGSSWISAASFQETSRILALAALSGETDWIIGFKRNVILGNRIPTRKPLTNTAEIRATNETTIPPVI